MISRLLGRENVARTRNDFDRPSSPRLVGKTTNPAHKQNNAATVLISAIIAHKTSDSKAWYERSKYRKYHS